MLPSPPIIVAHRGLHTVAAENSLGAFSAAALAKIPWVECDVWPSADGVVVVIHDETLDRTTGGTGKVGNLLWRQLQQLQVPSLSDVLTVLPREIGILVEIKPPNATRLTGSIISMLAEERAGPWMVQSFHMENVEMFASQGFNIPAAILVEELETLRICVEGILPMIHAEHSLIQRAIVDRMHTAGRKIGAWTVNTSDDIQRMIDLGVDMLITDEPGLAAQIIATR